MRAAEVVVERDGRTWRVFAVNEAGERWCMTRTRDRGWADTYATHAGHFFGVDVSRSADAPAKASLGPETSKG